MLDHLTIKCPHCEASHYLSISFVKGMIKATKIGKVGEVAQQLKEKRGPFYERWKVAMELRGAQKRCKTCLGFEPDDPVFFSNLCGYTGEKVNPGQFACKKYIRFDRN